MRSGKVVLQRIERATPRSCSSSSPMPAAGEGKQERATLTSEKVAERVAVGAVPCRHAVTSHCHAATSCRHLIASCAASSSPRILRRQAHIRRGGYGASNRTVEGGEN